MISTRPHQCPHCRCVHDLCDDMGTVNKTAEFYPLVELIDRARPATRRKDAA